MSDDPKEIMFIVVYSMSVDDLLGVGESEQFDCQEECEDGLSHLNYCLIVLTIVMLISTSEVVSRYLSIDGDESNSLKEKTENGGEEVSPFEVGALSLSDVVGVEDVLDWELLSVGVEFVCFFVNERIL